MNRFKAHPHQEGHNALEPSNRMGKGAMENYGPEEATWELEDAMQLAHLFFFNSVDC